MHLWRTQISKSSLSFPVLVFLFSFWHPLSMHLAVLWLSSFVLMIGFEVHKQSKKLCFPAFFLFFTMDGGGNDGDDDGDDGGGNGILLRVSMRIPLASKSYRPSDELKV
jgi:hypothetical protein